MDEREPTASSILFVTWNFPPRRGGIEEMAWRLSEGLRRHAAVQVLTGRVHRNESSSERIARSPLPGLLGFLVWLTWRLPLAFVRGEGSTVMSIGGLIGSFVEILARLAGRPHAVLVFGTDVTYPSRLYQRWLGWVLPGVPRLLAISEAVEAELTTRGLARSAHVTRLTPGVDPSIVGLPRDESIATPAEPILLFVGRIVERKGLEPFIEHCLPRIVSRHAVRLWIVGDEPHDSLAHRAGALADLRAKLAGSPLEPRIRFFGLASDSVLRAIYRVSHVLVLPAIRVPGDVEGFGIVFLEAALFGVPAVSTRIGGIPDAVVDRETGILVEPGDWDGFADAVVELLENEELHRALGRRARERALSEYDWRSISARCHEILREIRRE
ncbi:MAG TPA: glycosyltransferase family 4 protein [Thermoanaerobaculia bacterium]